MPLYRVCAPYGRASPAHTELGIPLAHLGAAHSGCNRCTSLWMPHGPYRLTKCHIRPVRADPELLCSRGRVAGGLCWFRRGRARMAAHPIIPSVRPASSGGDPMCAFCRNYFLRRSCQGANAVALVPLYRSCALYGRASLAHTELGIPLAHPCAAHSGRSRCASLWMPSGPYRLTRCHSRPVRAETELLCSRGRVTRGSCWLETLAPL